MNVLSQALIAATLVAVSATASSACNVNVRQYSQQHRIIKGAVQGDLSLAEFLRLERGQKKVRQLERAFRASGGISPMECAILNSAIDWQSVRIFAKRHN
jgi:hypothetical protein